MDNANGCEAVADTIGVGGALTASDNTELIGLEASIGESSEVGSEVIGDDVESDAWGSAMDDNGMNDSTILDAAESGVALFEIVGIVASSNVNSLVPNRLSFDFAVILVGTVDVGKAVLFTTF